MMCVTSVDPYWLGEWLPYAWSWFSGPPRGIRLLSDADNPAELGGVFFSIRERNFDALARAKANREFGKRTELEAEMARQRDQWVSSVLSVFLLSFVPVLFPPSSSNIPNYPSIFNETRRGHPLTSGSSGTKRKRSLKRLWRAHHGLEVSVRLRDRGLHRVVLGLALGRGRLLRHGEGVGGYSCFARVVLESWVL